MVDSTNLPEVDINQIATDLNGKMDRDCLNASDTGNIQMAKASIPGDKRISLTLNASGSNYTAPADGYFYFYSSSVANSLLFNTTKDYGSTVIGASGYENCNLLFVNKNDVVQLKYSTNVGSSLKFIYANGSESEAS